MLNIASLQLNYSNKEATNTKMDPSDIRLVQFRKKDKSDILSCPKLSRWQAHCLMCIRVSDVFSLEGFSMEPKPLLNACLTFSKNLSSVRGAWLFSPGSREKDEIITECSMYSLIHQILSCRMHQGHKNIQSTVQRDNQCHFSFYLLPK